jgi:hypothetical protein
MGIRLASIDGGPGLLGRTTYRGALGGAWVVASGQKDRDEPEDGVAPHALSLATLRACVT